MISLTIFKNQVVCCIIVVYFINRSKEIKTKEATIEDIATKEKQLQESGKSKTDQNEETEKEMQNEVALPEDLMKLEWHFNKPPSVHNDDKIKRALLCQIKQEVEAITDPKEFRFTRDIPRSHCLSRFRIRKPQQSNEVKLDVQNHEILQNADNSNNNEVRVSSGVVSAGENFLQRDATTGDGVCDLSMEDLTNFVSSLTIHEIDFVHLYSEGTDITVADLILFTYLYFLLVGRRFQSMPCFSSSFY